MTNIEKALIDILGKSAYNTPDFKLDEDIRKLACAVRYLTIQLEICQNYMENKDIDYVDGVQRNLIQILKGELQ
jgi:hypothetical protein